MANYTPTTWTNGDLITAEKLNKIESAISSVASKTEITNMREDFNNITAPGLYYYSSGGHIMGNRPTGNNFVLKVINIDPLNSMLIQACIPYNTNALYIRTGILNNSVYEWTEWANQNALLSGFSIAANTDLNEIIDSGTYYAESNSRAQTLLNCPTDVLFSLEVKQLTGKKSIMQTIYVGKASGVTIYRRYSWNGGQLGTLWTNWFEFTGTEIIPEGQ